MWLVWLIIVIHTTSQMESVFLIKYSFSCCDFCMSYFLLYWIVWYFCCLFFQIFFRLKHVKWNYVFCSYNPAQQNHCYSNVCKLKYVSIVYLFWLLDILYTHSHYIKWNFLLDPHHHHIIFHFELSFTVYYFFIVYYIFIEQDTLSSAQPFVCLVWYNKLQMVQNTYLRVWMGGWGLVFTIH